MRSFAAVRHLFLTASLGGALGLAGGAAAALAREPVVIVTAAGVDRLLADVDYLSDLADRPEVAGFVRGVQGMVNNLKGFDKSRPVSIVAYLPEDAAAGAPPEVALVVPVKNTADLQKTIGGTKRLTLQAGPIEGEFILETPQKKLPVRIIDGWAIVSEQESLFSEPSLLTDRRISLLGANDFAAYIAWSALPPRIVDEAVEKMTRDRDKERARRDGEKEIEFETRQLGMDVILKSGECVLRDLEGISLTVNVDEKGKRLSADLNLTPRPGTPLAEQFARLQTPTQFAAQTASADAFLMTIALASPKIVHEGLDGLVEKGRREADQKVADVEQKQLINRLIDVAADMLGGRTYDGFLRVVPSENNHLSLIAGARCGKDGELASLLGQVLPEAAKSSDVKGLKIDAIQLDGVRIHQIEPAQTRKEDEKLFGTEASVFIGTGRGAVWGALGGPQTAELLKGTIAPATVAASVQPGGIAALNGGETAPVFPVPLFSVVIHLKKWAGLIEQAAEEPPQVRTAIATALREADGDEVAIRLRTTPTGLQLQFTADDAAAKAVFAAIAAKREP